MGAQNTKNSSLDGYVAELNREELECLETMFKSLIVDSSDKAQKINSDELQKLFGKVLSDDVANRLCRLVADASASTRLDGRSTSPQNKDSRVVITWRGLLNVASQFLKGSCTEQCQILMGLACIDRQPRSQYVSSQDMIHFVSDAVKSYLGITATSRQYHSWQNGVQPAQTWKLTLFLLAELFHKGQSPKQWLEKDIPDATYDLEAVEEWYSRSPLGAHIINKVICTAFRIETARHVCDDGTTDELLPTCSGTDWTKVKSVLTLPDILFLNQHLPTPMQQQWRYLFSSRQYGESFSQLVGRVVGRGPNVVVVRDRGGDVFGGFASCSWQIQSKFSGTNECFLFRLHPQLAVFPSAGYNDHYMYLNVNQQTMPNGLGMGGQLEYFGLYINDNYGTGTCSKSCTTFQSPQLCSAADFEIDVLEVWGVGPEPKLEESERRSALDSMDPEVKAILEMVGKAPISDDIRKTPDCEEFQKAD